MSLSVQLEQFQLSAAMMDLMPRSLTDTELLLWNLEEDPKLTSTMGSVMILDGPPDRDRLTSTISHALEHVAPLRERVYEPSGPVGVPSWGLDTFFDLESHLRFIRLPTPASRRALFDLATSLINDPFDRTRPLWSWTIVTGLPGGRAAVVSKLHHSVADGQGALKLAEHLLEFAEDAPPPTSVTPAEVLGPLADEPDEPGHDPGTGLRSAAERLLSGLSQAAGSVQSPGAALAAGQDVATVLKSLANSEEQISSASPLLTARSRNRRGGFLSVPLPSIVKVAKQREQSVNDVFVAAMARGIVNYHQNQGVALPSVSTTVVVSTRASSDGEANTQNAFVPVSIKLPGDNASIEELITAVGDQMATRRQQVSARGGLLGSLTGMAGMLPAKLAVAAALGQAAKVDLSTSNLPGPPVPVWIAGKRLVQLYPLGPVGGTACNATLLSHDGLANIGLHIDSAAVADIESFEQAIAQGFVDLGVRRPKSR